MVVIIIQILHLRYIRKDLLEIMEIYLREAGSKMGKCTKKSLFNTHKIKIIIIILDTFKIHMQQSRN